MSVPRTAAPGGLTRLAQRLAVAALAVVASGFVVYGLWAIASFGLTELYADQWRMYPPYLQFAFPENVFRVENGHRTVVPSLIRLAENLWLDGNQRLQLAAGAAFALAAWVVLAWVTLRERGLSPPTRWMVVALAAFALFWLGNARMLLHGTEAIQVYLIIACQAGAATLLARARAGAAAVALACVLALIATLSFGSGLAVFPAAAIVLGLQRRWRPAAAVLAATALTLVLYLLLPGGDGVRGTLEVRPLANAQVAATWLASMWVTLLGPLMNVDAGAGLWFGLDHATRWVARAWMALFGDARVNPAPFAVLGWLGLAALAWHSWRAWSLPSPARLALVGLGCAWFALGVAGIVALGRLDYFVEHPDQIFANRYLPWSCLFWFGLLAAACGLRARNTETSAPRAASTVPGTGPAALSVPMVGTGRGVAGAATGVVAAVPAGPVADGRAPRWVLLPAGVMLLMGALTSPGHRVWSELVQQGVRLDMAAFASGVVEADRSFGETIAEEVIVATPALRAARLSGFAWPEARLLGSAAAPAPVLDHVEPVTVELQPVGNRLGGSATRLQVRFQRNADVDMPDRLMVVVGGRVRAVLVRQTVLPGWSWAGVAPLALEPGGFALHSLAGDGTQRCWLGCATPTPPDP